MWNWSRCDCGCDVTAAVLLSCCDVRRLKRTTQKQLSATSTHIVVTIATVMKTFMWVLILRMGMLGPTLTSSWSKVTCDDVTDEAETTQCACMPSVYSSCIDMPFRAVMPQCNALYVIIILHRLCLNTKAAWGRKTSEAYSSPTRLRRHVPCTNFALGAPTPFSNIILYKNDKLIVVWQ